jgi:acylphosphatase
MSIGKHIVIIGHFIKLKRFLQKEALRLGVSGVLTKVNNHTLDIQVTGENDAIKEFVNLCKSGNIESTVYNIKIENKDFGQPFFGFEILVQKSIGRQKPFWKKMLGF